MKQLKAVYLFLLVVGLSNGCATQETTETSESDNSASYAALAVVPQQGRLYHGYAKADTASGARNSAYRKCDNTKCTVVQLYTSGQCANIALGNDQIYWNEEDFSTRSREAVMAFCGRIDTDCQIIVSECLN